MDALSQNPVVDERNDPISTFVVVDLYPAIMSITNDDWLHNLQLGDSEQCRIKDISTLDLNAEWLKHVEVSYVINMNILYRRIDDDRTNLRQVVPKGARSQLC